MSRAGLRARFVNFFEVILNFFRGGPKKTSEESQMSYSSGSQVKLKLDHTHQYKSKLLAIPVAGFLGDVLISTAYA